MELIKHSNGLRVSYKGIIPAFQAGSVNFLADNLIGTLHKLLENIPNPDKIRTRSGHNPEFFLAAPKHQFSAENIPLQQCEGFFFGLNPDPD
jgi:hypothetical protein